MKLELLGRMLFSWIKVILPWLFVVLVIALLTWRYPNYQQRTHSTQKSDRETVLIPGVSAKQTEHLIEQAAPGINNSFEWSKDLRDTLAVHHLELSRENICAMIAVISQESSFAANPSISVLSEKDLRVLATKWIKLPLFERHNERSFIAWLRHKPTIRNSYWKRFRNAKTERELDWTYRKMISDTLSWSSKDNNVLQNNVLLRNLLEDANEISTIGSMQVAVSFAMQIEEQRITRPLNLEEVWAMRDRMYTRKGGMYYGALLLLGYDVGYDKKLYRFADFNAGRFASRNAAFQATVAELLGKPVTADGDLLMYDPQGKPATTVSNSEHAINEIIQKYDLGLTAIEIHNDLLQEKQINFSHTQTYQIIRQHYQKLMHKQALTAIVPNIVLRSEKNTEMMSTEKFTNTVNSRYQQCMGER
ncbi:DUF1615 family protein [Crenothrix sp.]|uniref:DUF1615 family protein n=1 Tax=Crenothrix sp. TaxID=3100433 RepID=UPI00374D54E9